MSQHWCLHILNNKPPLKWLLNILYLRVVSGIWKGFLVLFVRLTRSKILKFPPPKLQQIIFFTTTHFYLFIYLFTSYLLYLLIHSLTHSLTYLLTCLYKHEYEEDSSLPMYKVVMY
jgi:hypothetical protein